MKKSFFFLLAFFMLHSSFLILYSQERYSTKLGIIKEHDFKLPFHANSKKLKFEFIDGKVIMEGDIIVGYSSQFQGDRAVAIDSDFRWANNTIPFVIAQNHPQTVNINWAINHINQNTNIRLILRTTENDFVNFVSGGGCSSFIGRQGGNQDITIGNCSRGSIAHEILHAAGLFHEQSREDRNNFIRVNANNIEQGRADNFQQHIDNATDIGNYDYGSIMHYSADAFSRNGQNTIDILSPPAPAGTTIGQRNGLSQEDINAVNKLYPSLISEMVFDGNTFKIKNYYFTDVILDASASNSKKAQLWEDLGNSSKYAPNANNQKWIFKRYEHGNYKIINKHSKKVLEVSASTGKLQLWENLENRSQYVANANNQKWFIVKHGEGVYQFVNVFSGKTLEAASSNKKRAQVYNDMENSNRYVPMAKNQKWVLIKQ